MAGEVVNIKVCSPLKLRSGLIGKYHAICHYSYNLPLPNIMSKSSNSRIILEFNLSTHQMTHLSLIALALIVIASAVLRNELILLNVLKLIGLLILFGFTIMITFSKKGLLQSNNKIYKGYFFGNLLLYKKTVNLNNKIAFAILKLRKKQKMAFFTGANPDLAESFETFDIALLNENHTQKEILISLLKVKNSESVTEFLKNHTNLKLEIYSPNFYN